MTRWRVGWLLLAVVPLIAFFLVDLEPGFAPEPTGIVVSERARALHRGAIVIDLHADPLLWPRDLSARGGGQLDFPRMREGGLDVVALTLATRFFGVAGLKAFHDRWPLRTWFSPYERLRFQMEKASSFSGIELARGANAMRRRSEAGELSYFHGIEGAHALGGDITRVRGLKEEGVLFIGVVHLSDNTYGASSWGGGSGGLTERGEALIEEMNRAGVLVDLAHASEETYFDALRLTELPPIVSHAGVRAVHDSWRNLSDDQIRAVSDRGGVIGVMLAPPALGEPSLEEWFRHVEHVVEVGGEDVAAVGSDFDGYVQPPIDVSGLPQLTELMLRHGWSERRVRKVLGENALRVLESVP